MAPRTLRAHLSRVILTLTALVLLASLGVDGTIRYTLLTRQNEALRGHLLASLEAATARSLWDYDPAGIRENGDILLGFPDTVRVEVVDTDGTELYQGSKPQNGTPSWCLRDESRRLVFRGQDIGILKVRFSDASLWRQMFLLLLVALVQALLLGGMILLVARSASKHLSRDMEGLIRTSRRVSQGDFSARAEVTENTVAEVTTLATELDRMADQLRGAFEALEDRERAFRLLVENVPGAVYRSRSDPSWTKLYLSDKFARILGYPTERFFGEAPLHVTDLLHPQDRDRTFRALEEGIRQGRPFVMEYRLRHADGSWRWVSDHIQPDVDLQEGPTYYGIFIDITPRKVAEAERERILKELAAKNGELEQFTYTVSHDLKSPLITIKGFLGLLEQDLHREDRERAMRDAARIAAAADRMAELLDDLLELSRIGRIANPPSEVPLGDLAREAVRLLAGPLEEQNGRVEIPPNLPSLRGDRTRLLEVLQNLLENALKYRGDEAPHIVLEAREEADGVRCCVTDNGRGIDPRYLERIFGLFEKIDPRSEGSGVGLALVKRIVEFHGGSVWAESPGLGRGSRFCFRLPGDPPSA